MSTSPRLCIGIDIGKFRHVAAFISSSLLETYGQFSLCPTTSLALSHESIEQFLAALEKHLPLADCAVLLEHTGHYHRTLEQALLARGVSVYVIAVHTRKNSLDKTDKVDALRLANLLYAQLVLGVQIDDPAQRIQRLHPPAPVAAKLAYLVRRRYELVQDTTRHKNRLIAICDELFPEFTQVLRDPNTESALVLREKFPTPAAICGASLDELSTCRKRSHPGDGQLRKLQTLAEASLGITDPNRLRGLLVEQKQLIAELRLLSIHRAELDGEVTSVVESSREGQILLSFGCIGPIQAATILASIGTIANFANAAKLKKFCGWAPQSTQTGVSLDRSTLTPSGARLLKQTFYLISMSAVRDESEWKRLYDRLVPLKCSFDARTGQYKGKRRVLGRVIGAIIERIYLLLKQDYERLHNTPPGQSPEPPTLYDPSRANKRQPRLTPSSMMEKQGG